MNLFSNRFSYSLTLCCAFLFFVFGISSCIPPDVKGTADTQFFDLKGFLDNQINSLEKREVTITKKTILQGQKSEQTIKKIDWKDEFAFFYSADINTPQLRDRYKIEKTPQKWTFKTEEGNLIVKEMQIFFDKENDDSFENVKEVLIIQKDKNNLYENDRTLIIKVNKGLLESYSIKGSEDVILNEKQEFLVEGIVK
ncbi:MAG: hypothetical protein COZ18_05140 [Flexibacter sp. CG_4_10_14_3_um_filter_32_15]|nr:MAG: hypothetical protein COZ18_05140 [Flexibacter sp. CG_4_10_14_3_um_filter_32_15]